VSTVNWKMFSAATVMIKSLTRRRSVELRLYQVTCAGTTTVNFPSELTGTASDQEFAAEEEWCTLTTIDESSSDLPVTFTEPWQHTSGLGDNTSWLDISTVRLLSRLMKRVDGSGIKKGERKRFEWREVKEIKDPSLYQWDAPVYAK